jgi:hypothetical protein
MRRHFLNEIFIKDFVYKKSTDGNETLYNLKVISKRRLDCVLTGESSEDSVFFVVNPDQSDVGQSEELIDHGISCKNSSPSSFKSLHQHILLLR